MLLLNVATVKKKDVFTERGDGKKIGFYELIAERLGIQQDDENVMARGHRLEKEAIEMFEIENEKTVDTSLVLWAREDNESIAVSPDGVIGDTEAVEVKCLSSARHIEAVVTGKIPKEYKYQVLQYFIVNDALQLLHFVFYDPRIIARPYFEITVTRQEVQEDIEKMLEHQNVTLSEIDSIIKKLFNV